MGMAEAARVERRIVDNRVFLLGLDSKYRDAMSLLESEQLLGCARKVAATLGVSPADVPIEGYYTATPELTEYFRLMRALQRQPLESAPRVAGLPEFEVLHALGASGLFGPPRATMLLPRGADPLFLALEESAPESWRVPSLVSLAHEIAVGSDDFSLVGLAARTADVVLIAATRESVVLYDGISRSLDEPVRIVYEWRVDDELVTAANRFIRTLNEFVLFPVPVADADNAASFWSACQANDVRGRCVMIGHPPEGTYYHWAIAGSSRTDLSVEDFWHDAIWTTEHYLTHGRPRPQVH